VKHAIQKNGWCERSLQPQNKPFRLQEFHKTSILVGQCPSRTYRPMIAFKKSCGVVFVGASSVSILTNNDTNKWVASPISQSPEIMGKSKVRNFSTSSNHHALFRHSERARGAAVEGEHRVHVLAKNQLLHANAALCQWPWIRMRSGLLLHLVKAVEHSKKMQ
jgi:hypothetical protein